MYTFDRRKKGEEFSSGGSVAVILIVIALFMTLYLLFISPEERAKILKGDNDTDDDLDDKDSRRIELVAESPGLVSPTREFPTTHRIPSINIFLKTEPTIKQLASSLKISNSLFSDTESTLNFKIENLEDTTSANLFFSVEDSSGELIVKLNGNTIYSKEITNKGVEIVSLPKQLLEERNRLDIGVSSPGIAFWRTNTYSLKDIGVKQEHIKKNSEESRSFTLTGTEKTSLEKVRLKYTQQCNSPLESELTHLDIFVNEKRAYDSEIRCITTEEEIELDPKLFVEGSNDITFRLEKGDFSFNLIKLETESRETTRPTYFFTLTNKQFKDIEEGKRDIELKILLEKSARIKSSRIFINSNEVLMRTDKNEFELDLRDYVIEGTNFIRLHPVNSFTIIGLKVNLEKR